MNTRSTVESLLDQGFARADLPDADAAAVTAVYAAAERFFGRSEAEKRAHMSPDFNFGFRPQGRQVSVSPERPDLNESFTYWADEPGLIPGHELIGDFIRALSEYRQVAAALVRAVLAELARHFDSSQRILFEPYSYIEVNWYSRGETRDRLQDRHEDGQYLPW